MIFTVELLNFLSMGFIFLWTDEKKNVQDIAHFNTLNPYNFRTICGDYMIGIYYK